MDVSSPDPTHVLDDALILPPLRQALDDDSLDLIDWQCTQLQGGTTGGVYRITGRALTQAHTVPWSLILKSPSQQITLGDPYGGEREPVIYRSGALPTQPHGLCVPRCFGVAQQPHGGHWIWLEDVPEDGPPQWPIARYSLAAQHLGQFGGAFLVGAPRPAWPWVGNETMLPKYMAQFLPARDQLRLALDHWQTHYQLSARLCSRMLELYDERDGLCAVLTQLPQTICHGDADRRNFRSRRTADGNTATVALDWAFAGVGVIGQDISRMVSNAVAFGQIEPTQVEALEAPVFASYLSGLQTSGWHGEPQLVRLGYTASMAVGECLVVMGIVLVMITNELNHTFLERIVGAPIAAIISRITPLLNYQLALADEANTLRDAFR